MVQMKRIFGLLLALALLLGALSPAILAEEAGWVILVYLAGTDLETESGAASLDLIEMAQASTGPEPLFVVQTGGTREWALPDLIPNDRLARFEVRGKDLVPLAEAELASMGAAGTLRDFVTWGMETYPAARHGLIVWDHGSGSINGVVFDELFDNDSLSLMEIAEALAGFENAFEFIGFDACLMATLETAQTLAPFARYMVASEELEPGSGWDYLAIGQFLNANPGADGAQLGQVIADSFLLSNQLLGEDALATLSVVDLSRLAPLTMALDAAGWQMFEAMTQGGAALHSVARGVRAADNFGGNTPEEGYTNMVDIASMMRGVRDSVPGADEVLAALEAAVIYQVRGSGRQGVGGLSAYFPLQAQGSSEYQVFKQAAQSEGYRYFVGSMMYGAALGQTESLTAQGDAAAQEQVMEQAIAALADLPSDTGIQTAEQTQLRIDHAYLDADGGYTLALAPGSMDILLSATFTLLMDGGDGLLYNLGEDDEVDVDTENSLVRDRFDGTWPALPDGQLLPLYLLNQRADYNLYSAPVMLNGRQTNLRVLYNWEKHAFEVVGGWDGLTASGASSREIIPLRAGDSIVPLYEAYDAQTLESLGLMEGEPYPAQEGFSLEYKQLPAADYHYGFTLRDIYGLSAYSDFTLFTVDNEGGLWFYPEE